jgi:CelD/BcsL family acetyltransferase involved in cellulose biosynthesis
LLIRLDDELDEYLANQGGRRYRGDLRRDQRRAGEQGLRSELLSGPADVPAFLAAAADVWAQSWQRERSGALPTDGKTLAEITHAAERGWFRGYVLREASGHAVAFLWMLCSDGVLRSVKTAFTPACASLSPGKLLLHRAVVDAHAEGVRLVDFGYGDYPYKRRWANDRLSTRGLLFVRPAARPLVACVPPAGYRRVRAAAIHGLAATGLEDRARRFSSRRMGR